MAVTPADVRHIVCLVRAPRRRFVHAVHGGLTRWLSPPLILTEAARKAIEVIFAFILWHPSSEHSAYCDHDGGMSADKQRLGTVWILVGLLNDLLETVGYTIVKLWNTLALRTWNDGRGFGSLQVIEMLVEFGDVRWGGMIKSREAIELSHTRLDVDTNGFTSGQSACEGFQSLQAAVEGRTVDQVDWGIDGEEVLAQLLGLLDAVSRESGIRDDSGRGWDVGGVCASRRVDGPVGAVLRVRGQSLSRAWV